MKLEGSYTIHAPRETVWRRLMDPEALAHALPGCEKLEPQPDGSYRAEMKVGIAAIKGSYQAQVEILDPVPPEHFRLKIKGQGTGGFLEGEGTLTLAQDGDGTAISYSGEAHVGGVVATVGQRLILGAARQVVNQFFQTFSKQLQGL
jgi:carbon monoxide dehydrogenase subunit G